jgi:hypothetical protein
MVVKSTGQGWWGRRRGCVILFLVVRTNCRFFFLRSLRLSEQRRKDRLLWGSARIGFTKGSITDNVVGNPILGVVDELVNVDVKVSFISFNFLDSLVLGSTYTNPKSPDLYVPQPLPSLVPILTVVADYNHSTSSTLSSKLTVTMTAAPTPNKLVTRSISTPPLAHLPDKAYAKASEIYST